MPRRPPPPHRPMPLDRRWMFSLIASPPVPDSLSFLPSSGLFVVGLVALGLIGTGCSTPSLPSAHPSNAYSVPAAHATRSIEPTAVRRFRFEGVDPHGRTITEQQPH